MTNSAIFGGKKALAISPLHIGRQSRGLYVASHPEGAHRLIIISNDSKTLIWCCFPVLQQCFTDLKIHKKLTKNFPKLSKIDSS